MTDGTEKRLTEILKSLPAAQAGALLEFAEFLLIRHGVDGLDPVKNIAAVEIPKPLDISCRRRATSSHHSAALQAGV